MHQLLCFLYKFLVISYVFLPVSHSKRQVLGSCDFEGQDWSCGYQQGTADDNFDWSHVDENGNHFMLVNTMQHQSDTIAQLTTPEIKLQNTHCFKFRVYLGNTPLLTNESNSFNNTAAEVPGELNVYLLDHENGELMQPVWNSSGLASNMWHTIQLALNPRSYQIEFEAVVVKSAPGSIAIDDVVVSSSACESTAYFLRLGDKEVNTGQNATLQCLLWGHSGPTTKVTMQKSTGTTILPFSREEHDDHLSVIFKFFDVSTRDGGLYRCMSGNATQLGVSNYAHLFVKEPPRPNFTPQIVKPGATNFVIKLNSASFSGDGPVVQTILNYRPVEGSWSDVHHISTAEYHLWNLQPDTRYDLVVTLVRPGEGGTGQPGPVLHTKTNCGLPKSKVNNVKFLPLSPDDPSSIRVQWDAPDFSITQCHNYAIVVKYRMYSGNEADAGLQWSQSRKVKDENAVIISGLEVYKKYMFIVEITNSAGSKETGVYTAQTGEGVPGPVPLSSFKAVLLNDTAIDLRWDEPLHSNGILRGYEVSYDGIESFDPSFIPRNDIGLFQVSAQDRRLTISPLHPGTTYQISIRAKTSVGLGSSINITERTDIAPPTMPDYPPPSNDTTSTAETIEITIIPAQSNGAPISNYYVIVEEVSSKPKVAPFTPKTKKPSRRGKKRKKKKRTRKTRSILRTLFSRTRRQAVVDTNKSDMHACLQSPLTYQQSRNSHQSTYAGARFNPDQITEDTKFVVGDGSTTNGFENPSLDPNKEYNIYVRVESSVNNVTTVSCALVAKKARVIPSVLPPPPSFTVSPTSPDSVLVNGANVTEKTSNPTGGAGIKDASEQEQLMMYAGIGGAVVGILLITIIVIVIVIKMKRKNKSSRKDEVVNPFEVRMMMTDMNSPAHTLLPINQSGSSATDRQALMPDVVGYDHQDFLEKASENGAAGYASTNDERFAVRVDDFHVHVSQMKNSGGFGFREEFASFPDGQSAPWTVANNPQNRSKNRYGNIMAYDHSRVVLDPPPGLEEEFESDYINASYINGYKSPSMYIATQAPSPETCDDFWWMIWQEKSNVIVMVTNLVELSKRKSHKYWPDGVETFGTVQVSLSNEEHMADYVVRSFVLQQVDCQNADGYDVREVKQFHFTAWPDHGVPSRPTNLLAFIRRIKLHEPQGQGPSVIHCSAGSGRTGCFIVIDMMLDMARDEEIVDIHNTVRDLRSRRVNMVQTEEQYVFIHEAVLEALLCGETSVAASMLVHHYDDLITVDPQTHFAPIQEEFETLNVITPKLTEDECSVARLPRNRASNRFMDVLPADRHLAYLVTPDPADRENNYINAVYLDSYSTKNSFLVTQMPLPNTVIDIWRLIYDHNCTSVVMMNDVSEHDQTCSQYWPESGSAIFGPFTVELLTKDDEVDVVTRLFKLQNTSRIGEPYRVIQQFQLTNWPASQPVPYSRNAVLRVIQLVTKWQAECMKSGNGGRVLVHCVAGAGRSGTFVSCYNMCEQLRHEYAVDVFNIVQRLRNVRPQLVETLEQYRFCYEVGIEFADR